MVNSIIGLACLSVAFVFSGDDPRAYNERVSDVCMFTVMDPFERTPDWNWRATVRSRTSLPTSCPHPKRHRGTRSLRLVEVVGSIGGWAWDGLRLPRRWKPCSTDRAAMSEGRRYPSESIY